MRESFHKISKVMTELVKISSAHEKKLIFCMHLLVISKNAFFNKKAQNFHLNEIKNSNGQKVSEGKLN